MYQVCFYFPNVSLSAIMNANKYGMDNTTKECVEKFVTIMEISITTSI